MTTNPYAYDYFIAVPTMSRAPKPANITRSIGARKTCAPAIDDDFDGDGLAVAEAYFANVAKVAEKKPTILGHFDLIKKINDGNKFFDENDPRYTAAATSALMAAARSRCVLEVNTSAAYRGFRKDYFPSDAILKEWLVLSGQRGHHRRCPRHQGPDLRFRGSRRPPERAWLHQGAGAGQERLYPLRAVKFCKIAISLAVFEMMQPGRFFALYRGLWYTGNII